MARIQQDQFIDEDEEEEVCPLCVEEFDLGDKYFRPCPCGYQVRSPSIPSTLCLWMALMDYPSHSLQPP